MGLSWYARMTVLTVPLSGRCRGVGFGVSDGDLPRHDGFSLTGLTRHKIVLESVNSRCSTWRDAGLEPCET